jgi:hypothetical protein
MKLAVLTSGLFTVSLPVTDSTHCVIPQFHSQTFRRYMPLTFLRQNSACSLLHAVFLLSFFFDPEEGGLFSVLVDMF